MQHVRVAVIKYMMVRAKAPSLPHRMNDAFLSTKVSTPEWSAEAHSHSGSISEGCKLSCVRDSSGCIRHVQRV